jgi:hypothetical protein
MPRRIVTSVLTAVAVTMATRAVNNLISQALQRRARSKAAR